MLIATIRKYRDQLHDRFERIKSGTCNPIVVPSQPMHSEIGAKPSGSGLRLLNKRPTKIIPLKPYRERINFEKVIVSNTIKCLLVMQFMPCEQIAPPHVLLKIA